MKRHVNIRTLIIIMLCITIICMCIGFAYLSVILENKNNEKPILDISFTKITEETPIKGGMISPVGTKKLSNANKTLDFNFILYTPQDELSYTIIVENTGTLPAKIEDILTYPNYLDDEAVKNSIYPITITHNDLSGKVLEPDEQLQIKLVVSYMPKGNIGQVSIPYQLTVLASSVNK